MKERIVVNATRRDATGTSSSGQLRRAGELPAVVYGKGESGICIRLNHHDFEQMLGHHQSEHMMLDLKIEKDPAQRVLLKEVQHHPVTGHAIHADFQVVALDERLRVEIPVELTGEPVGVTRDGGILEHLLREIEVECLPKDLIESVSVDVSHLEIGHHLSISAIQLDPDLYKILTDPEIAIASVSAPRLEEEEPEKEEGAEAGEEEPELVKEKEEEKEEETETT